MKDAAPPTGPTIPEQRARIRATFDAVADTYDAVGVPFFVPIADGLVAELDVAPGERVVDMGCGRGAALMPLAAAVGPDGRVTGLDLSPRMVERTSADLLAAGLAGRVDVRVGDVQDPGLPASSVDAITSSLVVFFLPDPGGALRAWREALVEGGRVGISTFGPLNPEWDVEEVFRPYLPPGVRDPRFDEGSPFSSDAGVEELMGAAGLTQVRTVITQVPVRFADPDAWYHWSMSVGQRQIWAGMSASQVAETRQQAAERLEACRRPDGGLGFEQTVRYTLGVR